MAAVESYLVRRDDGLVLLFTPPFDKAPLDPGYIKGYPPGIRENGGQYTHAALVGCARLRNAGRRRQAGRTDVALLNPINHASTRAADCTATRSSPTSSPPTSTRVAAACRPRRLDLVHRFRRAGCIASREGLLGCKLQGSALVLDPCIPSTWPSFELHLRHGTATYDILVENPNRVNRGVARRRARRFRVERQSTARCSVG